jgi:hypothetical protein
MKIRTMRFVFVLSGITVFLFVFPLWTPYQARSQTPAGPAAQTPLTKATQAGQAQPQKGNVSASELDQRLQAFNRALEGNEKKIEEFSKLVAKERSRLPSESVLLDQYLFLQSQVQELETKVDQFQAQPRATAQRATSDATPPQPEEKNLLTLLGALLLSIFVVLLYDRLFNARRFTPLEERIEHVEEYAYGKKKSS